MKKIVWIVLCAFLFSLTACSADIPHTVTIDGVTYRDGFYGDLWPKDLIYESYADKVGENEFHRVNCKSYDWVQCSKRGTENGVIYCAENQWEQAKAYYSDNNNFVYYCKIGDNYPLVDTISNMDSSKFDELMAFADKNGYKPFGSNKGVKTRRMPVPNYPELNFYKESNDGNFTSYKGYKFIALDGKLLLLYYYDSHYGKSEEELVAVDVPDEIGQYFIDLLSQLRQ